jgi:hypothetical protein
VKEGRGILMHRPSSDMLHICGRWYQQETVGQVVLCCLLHDATVCQRHHDGICLERSGKPRKFPAEIPTEHPPNKSLKECLLGVWSLCCADTRPFHNCYLPSGGADSGLRLFVFYADNHMQSESSCHSYFLVHKSIC